MRTSLILLLAMLCSLATSAPETPSTRTAPPAAQNNARAKAPQAAVPTWTAPDLDADSRRWTFEQDPPPEIHLSDAKALNNAGYEHYKAKRLGYAIRLWEKAVERDPTYVTARYNLACAYSLARVNGRVCEYDAYSNRVLDLLEGVVTDDPSRRDKMRTDIDLAGVEFTVRYRVLTGADPNRDRKALVTGLTFWSTGMGAFGSTHEMTLQTDGRVDHWRLNVDTLESSESVGTWRIDGDRILIDNVPYWLDAEKGWLKPSLSADPWDGYYDHPSECEA